jgi:hypothetical protein
LKPNPAAATENDKASDKKPAVAKPDEADVTKAAAARPAGEEARKPTPTVVEPPSTATVSTATTVAPKAADAPKTEPAPVVVPPPPIPVEAERKASTPTIVEPRAEQPISPRTVPSTGSGKAATAAAAATAAVAASAAVPPLDIRDAPHSPPPRSPSAIADEEATLGAPPAMSSSATGDKGKASQASRRSSTHDDEAPHKSQPAGGRSRRESIQSDEEAQDVLLDAAWDGDVDAVARALRNASVNGCDLHGQTALHLAAERDKLAVVMLLLDRGADVHARSDGGRTPLHLAARSASSSTVETLLERGGADPNARTAKGRTALHYAASAARDGDEERREVLRILRDWGADPTIEDRDGETARDVAQKRSHWDAASTLKRAERRWEEEHKQNWLQRHGFMK